MTLKEKSSDVKELETTVRRGESDAKSEDKDGLKLLEQLVVLMKLRLLRKTTETGALKKETIDNLEKDLTQDGDMAKKHKANLKLEDLFTKMVGVENGLDDLPINALMIKAKMPPTLIEVVTNLENRMENLKSFDFTGNKRSEAIIITEGLLAIGERLGITKASERVKETLVEKLNSELAEVGEIKRKLELIKVQEEIKSDKDKGKTTRVDVAKTKSLAFVNKELEGNPDRVTKVRIKKVRDNEARILQEQVDQLLKDVQKDLNNPATYEALDINTCLNQILTINTLERKAGKMKFPGKVSDHFFELQLLYQVKLEDILEEQKINNGEQLYNLMRDLWVSKNIPSTQELSEKINRIVSSEKKNNPAKKDGLKTPEEAIDDLVNNTLGVDQRRGRMPGGGIVEGIKDILDQYKIDVRTLFNQFKGRSKVEFADVMRDSYGFTSEQAGLFYESIFKNRGEVRNETFKNYLDRQDYKGYTEALISYLSAVGLREGMNDLQLLSLMNEARFSLSEAGKEGEMLLEVFKSFESMAFFHDKYFNLGAKEYGEILNHLGNGPLWVWLQEHANVLKNEIMFEGGEKEGEKATLSVLEMHDMMQMEHWAKRLAYTPPIREGDLFDEMMVSHLMNNNEPCKILENGDVVDMDDVLLGNIKDSIVVDGQPSKSLEAYMHDSRWKVGTAQDIWRLTGRNLNILDDINIGSALGINKGLLGITKICRYSEQYEFISSYQHDIMGADTFLYDFDWYKDTFGKGMKKLFVEAKIDAKQAETTQKLISKHIMSKRRVGKEVFYGSNLAIEDVKLLARGNNPMSFDEAKNEYLGRLKRRGQDITKIVINPNSNEGYTKQIKLFMEKWNDNLFTKEEMAQINALPWDKINEAYAKRLGKEDIGNDFASFIQNFSYARTAEYVEILRGTDMKDYGGYYNTAAEAVAGAIKSGLANGSSQALAKMIGAMETYHPYDATGLNRLGLAMWREVLKWRTSPPAWNPTRRVPKQSKGYILPNGDLMVNKYGRWEKEMKTEVFAPGDSLMQRYKYLPTWNREDIEMSMRFLVGKGIFTRKDGDAELTRRIGPRPYRWLLRAILLNDWDYFWMQLEKDSEKVASSFFKYVFSTK